MSSKRKGNRRKRKENYRTENIVRYYIACEGKETEVNYFNGIKEEFNKKGLLRKDPNLLKIYDLTISGFGMGANGLIDKVKRRINREANIYDKIWIVFDKDNIIDTDFNEAIKDAKNNGYNVAWSNKCFELWLLLHFKTNESDLDCKSYIKKLDSEIKNI